VDQQLIAIVKHIIKCFSCLPNAYVPNLCQRKSSLISRLISDRLLDGLPTVIQTLPQLVNFSVT